MTRGQGNQVVSWIISWWKDKTVTVWGGCPLKKLVQDDWFEWYRQDMSRIWTTSPTAMETVVELFNGDRLVHPHILHVFSISCVITHLWRKQLSKDVDVLFTVNVGLYFFPIYA